MRALVRGASGLRVGGHLDHRPRADAAVARHRATRPSSSRARPREDPAAGLPDGGFAAPTRRTLALFDPADRDVPLEARIDATRGAPRRAARARRRAHHELGGLAGDVELLARSRYANSAGFVGEYESASHSLVRRADRAPRTARCRRDYWLTRGAHASPRSRTPAAVGRRAAERALRRLGARARAHLRGAGDLRSAHRARACCGQLAGCVIGLCASTARRRFLAGKLGEAIASERVTIDRRRRGARAASAAGPSTARGCRRGAPWWSSAACSRASCSTPTRRASSACASTGNATRGAGQRARRRARPTSGSSPARRRSRR